MKIFNDTGKIKQSDYFGWQDKDSALYGLREGYKNSADELVNIVLKNENNIMIRDTYIFPVLFSYRHSIEISLKLIYLRATGKILSGGHNLLTLWDNIKKEIIDGMICSEEFIEQVKDYKANFVSYSLDQKDMVKIRSLLKELQEANQQDNEVNKNSKQIDQNAEVWRYLINNDNILYFKKGHFVDYIELKMGIDFIYEKLDYIYHIIAEYLSS